MRTSAWSWSTAGTASVGTGWTPTPSSASTRPLRSTACPRRCSAAAASSRTVPKPACTSARRRRRSAPTTSGSCRRRCSAPGRCRSTRAVTTSVTGSSSRACPGQRYEVRGKPRVVNAHYLAPEIPATTPAPFDVADGAQRRTRQRAGQPRRGTVAVRGRRLGQDRHRCVHLAARQRGGPGRDLLGAAPRPVDAQPCARPAQPRRLHRDGGRHHGRRQPRRHRPTTCSSVWRSSASCCASTGP